MKGDDVAEAATPAAWPRTSCILTSVASLYFLSSPILGHMGPPRPCLVAGAILALSALMFFYKPSQRRGWGTLAVLTSTVALLLGAEAILPAIVGVTGGVTGAMWHEERSD